MVFMKYVYIKDFCGDEEVINNILCKSEEEYNKIIKEAKAKNKIIIKR